MHYSMLIIIVYTVCSNGSEDRVTIHHLEDRLFDP